MVLPQSVSKATRALAGGRDSEDQWSGALGGLAMNEAVLVGLGPGNARVQRFRAASRLTPHVRHRHKYTDVPVEGRDAFVFTRDGTPVGPPARTLGEFSELLGRCPGEVIAGHARRHDFSRWIANVYRDRTLATRVFTLEKDRASRPAEAMHSALAALISERYFLADALTTGCPPAVVSVPA